MLTQLLIEMDGVGRDSDGLMVLGATNCPWDLDQAMRRRLERRILIPLPDETGRMVMFKIYSGKDHSLADPADFRALAEATEGYSGSDISTVCKQALMKPVTKMMDAKHFKQVWKVVDDEHKLVWMPCSPGDPQGN
jgi:vacuolar protein-sorting-associated protein 4